MCKIVPRGHSANADAYLTPKIKEYIEGFQSGFEDLYGSETRCEFMQSDGGLVEFTRLAGLRAVLSGPAGGVVGYAKTSYDPADGTPVIGFDMVRKRSAEEMQCLIALISGPSCFVTTANTNTLSSRVARAQMSADTTARLSTFSRAQQLVWLYKVHNWT